MPQATRCLEDTVLNCALPLNCQTKELMLSSKTSQAPIRDHWEECAVGEMVLKRPSPLGSRKRVAIWASTKVTGLVSNGAMPERTIRETRVFELVEGGWIRVE